MAIIVFKTVQAHGWKKNKSCFHEQQQWRNGPGLDPKPIPGPVELGQFFQRDGPAKIFNGPADPGRLKKIKRA